MTISDSISPKLRKRLIEVAYKKSASHISSCLSCIDILETIYSLVDRQKIIDKSPSRDVVILSKGHATLAHYVVLERYEVLDQSLDDYLDYGSTMYGHPNNQLRGVEHCTGALGHGLPFAIGVSTYKKSQNLPGMVYVILGDGELEEGSNWEALLFLRNKQPDNLTIIIDRNCMTQMDPSNSSVRLHPYVSLFESLGFSTSTIDGHHPGQLRTSFSSSLNSTKVVFCTTIKGKGIDFMESDPVWHYRPLNSETYSLALSQLSRAS